MSGSDTLSEHPTKEGKTMLLVHWKTALVVALGAVACSQLGLGQVSTARSSQSTWKTKWSTSMTLPTL